VRELHDTPLQVETPAHLPSGVQRCQGIVVISLPDHIQIPAEAGKLTSEELNRKAKPRLGIGLAAEKTAEAMQKYPGQLTIPGVGADDLASLGKQAEDIDVAIADVEALLHVLKQANRLIDADAYLHLRKVLAFVRSQESFDPSLPGLVPHLIAYFE